MSAPAETTAAAPVVEEAKPVETPAAEPAPVAVEEPKTEEAAPAAEAPKEDAKVEVSHNIAVYCADMTDVFTARSPPSPLPLPKRLRHPLLLLSPPPRRPSP